MEHTCVLFGTATAYPCRLSVPLLRNNTLMHLSGFVNEQYPHLIFLHYLVHVGSVFVVGVNERTLCHLFTA